VKSLRIRFTREFDLDPLWYDEGWHEMLLERGYTDEEALREMLRVSWEEDWTSLVEEMLPAEDHEQRAVMFAEHGVTHVEVVDAS